MRRMDKCTTMFCLLAAMAWLGSACGTDAPPSPGGSVGVDAGGDDTNTTIDPDTTVGADAAATDAGGGSDAGGGGSDAGGGGGDTGGGGSDAGGGGDDAGSDDAGQEDSGSGGCKADLDCAGTEVGACEKAVCNTGTGECEKANADDGTLCDDGDACTESDVCASGTCGGEAKVCDDGNPCTDDACGADGNCAGTPIAGGKDCDDGDACTDKDSCDDQGACTGEALKCDDDNPCTEEACEVNWGCTIGNNSDACDDESACTESDTCAEGKCVGTDVSCDDGNPCTDDACNKDDGCSNTDNVAGCDDKNACTNNDVCAAGLCKAGTPVNCDDDNACTDDACDEATGCANKNKADGDQCDDGSACTSGDACKDGACQGDLLNCDDKNPCTKDACDKAKGCESVKDDSLKCDDGDLCTDKDSCKDGKCVGAGGPDCDDKNPCTDDSCDPKTKKCINTPNTAACDDGSKCTESDACAAGKCKPGKAIVCDDKNPCSDDTCNKDTGACEFKNNTKPCDDGDKCTAGDACKDGQCTAKPKVCDDKSVCTDDSCDTATGNCKYAPKPDKQKCEDGSKCTSNDACLKGKCVGAAVKCDDGDPCTTDKCNKTVGCLADFNTAACDDGNVCTLGDICDKGACKSGTKKKVCNDGNVCTNDKCDPAKGCVGTPNKNKCDDKNACTVNDNCDGKGNCVGAKKNCNDKNLCTNDSCDPKAGCKHANNTNKCSDGSVCTSGDVCKTGKCTPGKAITCNDGNVCTKDTCNKVKGCQFAIMPKGSKCDDKNSCTSNDACTVISGKAICKGVGKNCDDGKPCTLDSCKNNVCTYKNAATTVPCNDGNSCTNPDKCDGKGKCKGGAVNKCDDKNGCTDDLCVNKIGCTHKANTKPCSDGKYCTINDTCASGKCSKTTPRKCDDGNVCTYNYCNDVVNKCLKTNKSTSTKCSDKNACTLNDKCDGKGACKAGSPVKCDDKNPCTLDVCNKTTGKCGYTLSSKLCGKLGIPYTEGFSYLDSNWQTYNTDSKIGWRADNNGSPGKLTGSYSLNFNNGKNYSNNKKVGGTAVSKFLLDATKLKGNITFSFFSYHGVESSKSYDKRYIEFSIDGFKSIAKSVLLDNSKHKNAWHMEAIDISALKGKSFQVRFRFDSVDSINNTTPGWFVDEINAYAGPVKAVGAGGQYYDSFTASNPNGWQFAKKYGANSSTWKIDKTSSTPGAYSGESLNFNDGVNYSPYTAKGWALSPIIDLEPLAGKSGNVTLWFKSWHQTETTSIRDKRFVEISDYGFSTTSSSHFVKYTDTNTSSQQYGWRWLWVDLTKFKGKRIRVRFHFDSVNSYKNSYKGWFIDDMYVDNKPTASYGDMITCNAKSNWTISKGNSSGANWAVDNSGIPYKSHNCSLNFNAYNSSTKKYDIKCPAGKKRVFGSATSKMFYVKKPAAGAKTYLTFETYMNVESSGSYDYTRLYIRDVFKNQEKNWTLSKSNALKKWKKFTYDVSAYHGRWITVRFYFDSKDCINNTGTGVAVENVMVRANK